MDILSQLPEEQLQQVLNYFCEWATRDLGRVRIASKAVHEAMMDSNLDLSKLQPSPSVAQVAALGQGTVLQKFKQLPVEQQCSCVTGRALSGTSIGAEVPNYAWDSIPHQEQVAVGVGSSWRITQLDLTSYDITVEEWRMLLSCLNLEGTLYELGLRFKEGAFSGASTDLSIIAGTLTKLRALELDNVSGVGMPLTGSFYMCTQESCVNQPFLVDLEVQGGQTIFYKEIGIVC